MSKENLIKLLKAMSDNSYELHKIVKADRKWKLSAIYLAESITYDTMINLLTDPEYAEIMWKIYFHGEEVPAV